jgi:exodeoxyribonuclease-3
MKIATWNINSLTVRLPHVLSWLEQHQPDILAVQETKLINEKFPVSDLQAAGYQAVFYGQKTYNGVAILSRQPLTQLSKGIPDYVDAQARVIAASYGDLRVVNIYVPNGESIESPKYQYKQQWLEQLRLYLQAELKRYSKLIVLGDFNIAPENEDVHDPQQWAGQVLFSEPEREQFKQIKALGLVDSFRLFPQPEKSYTWWDYRMLAFRRNHGLRIDHILVSEALAKHCKSATIDKTPRKAERPSDHAPVTIYLS